MLNGTQTDMCFEERKLQKRQLTKMIHHLHLCCNKILLLV